MKNQFKTLAFLVIAALSLSACGTAKKADTTKTEQKTQAKLSLEDGIYQAKFTTDNRMFHVNEACNGKATLTVKGGEGTLHLVMPSKNVVNLFSGVASDAKKKGAELIQPTEEEITFEDGLKESVYAFDVPLPVVDQEYDLALVGTKGKWYDHKVKVTDVTSEGEFFADLSLEGGSGRASIMSPAKVTAKDKVYTVLLEWSSPYYDYMIVDGKTYKPVNKDGNSIFEVSFQDLSKPVKVIADTVAMSKPHEIEYTITCNHLTAH